MPDTWSAGRSDESHLVAEWIAYFTGYLFYGDGKMTEEKCRYRKKRFTAGAMCFMLFVWLGGVVMLCAVAAIIMQ
ncbi:hypothetical protein [Escherichia coli]|uniref:hypothetical protein n=1 Tax=Escherichia coli TaxID=562 RepID=UPI000CFACD50|nr:hypothetical protein [Escherichia coli]EIE3038532.1 hypothetical protein [Escherichia coli]MCJ2699230.1 hypothetical protein [Escherichia coli]MCN3363784.1 hypothetical protein [Escherichia coli]RDS54630.1 hypothetical protein C3984_03132 [Escherichia coli]HBP4333267.1 hypothetical protein [Escherichia coli]